jgi:uncharacterized protein (DUF2336 family)
MSTGYNNPDYLYRLARSGNAEDREKLAKSISSLLHADLSQGEMYLAQDILLHLLREAETDMRQTLALHLSVEPKCPKALIDYLVFECPLSVSEPVLKNSPILEDDYLIEVAKRFETPDYWRAIASREQVSKNLALFLIGTDDEQVYEILVRNLGAEFCSLCMNWLTGVAMNMPPLQEPLLQRKEITPELATKLYWHTSEKLQQDILQKFDIDKAVLDKAMQYVVSRRVEQKKGVQRISDEMWQIAQKLPKISSRQIMDAMQKGDRAFFACLCATYLKIDAEKVLQKLEARPMLALAVLTRAINMTRAEYNSLFLMWRRQDNTGGITNARELAHAMAVFDQMKPEQAKAEAASWSNTSVSEATH